MFWSSVMVAANMFVTMGRLQILAGGRDIIFPELRKVEFVSPGEFVMEKVHGDLGAFVGDKEGSSPE